MNDHLRPPLSYGLRAALLALPLVFAACGGDDDSDANDVSTEVSDTSDDETTSHDTGEDAGTDVEGADDGGTPPQASTAQCDLVPAEEVAAAAGIEVSSTTPQSGSGSYQEIDYNTVGCAYEVAEGGSVRITALTDESGTQLPAEVFADLTTASADSSADDFPHEEVAGLGNGALFLASLGPSDSLVIDASPAPILVVRNHRDLPLSRDALRAVGEVAVEAYS